MFFSSFKAELTHKTTLIFFVLAFLLLIFGTTAQYKKSIHSTNNDFRVYYKTSVRIHNGDWDNIYTRLDGAFPYRYVPYSLAAISWLDQFPEQTSRKIWLVLQALAFFGGFIYLYKSLILTQSKYPLLAVSIAVILTFRQYLDSLYSGQVSGFIFLSFCLGLYFYLKKNSVMDGISNSVATSLKILPGFLLIHGFIKLQGPSKKIKYLGAGILLFISLNLMIYVWLSIYHADQFFFDLWRNWLSIAMTDGEYFDGSTPKSQALRAFILRTFGKSENSEIIWKFLFLLGIIGIIIHWLTEKSLNSLQNAYSYSLGILAFIIFMPESLPYQLMNVAIPLAIIISDPKLKISKFYKITCFLFMGIISFASTDFIGRNASNWMQDQSFAFFVLCLMSYIVFKGSKNQVV